MPAEDAAAALRLTSQNPRGDLGDEDRDPDDEYADSDSDSDSASDSDDLDDSDDSDDSDDFDDVDRRPSVEPVGSDDDDDEDAEDLESVKRGEAEAEKARQRAAEERARADAERAAEKAREEARKGCDGLKTAGLGAVKPHVREAAAVLGCRFGEPVMYGVAGRGGPSDHPGGLAVDFMVNPATGDALAQCALANMEALGVKYVIWEQRINLGSGWTPMEDRGGVTANHFDHVHVSFERGAGSGELKGC